MNETPESWDWRSDWNVKTYMSEHLWLAELLAKVAQHEREEGKKEMLSKAIEKLENMRLFLILETASSGGCFKCGFPTDHQQCMCQHNNALHQAIEALKSLNHV